FYYLGVSKPRTIVAKGRGAAFLGLKRRAYVLWFEPNFLYASMMLRSISLGVQRDPGPAPRFSGNSASGSLPPSFHLR
ncbi:MAG: hypothetical protein AAB356_05745, partial [Deltaproteobacteria bacterium]